MTEKIMQSLFGKYLSTYPQKQTEIYELKICKSKALPFNAVQPHQIEALGLANDSQIYHKIADQPVSFGVHSKIRFTKKKPFDCFVLVRVPAYVVVWFYHPRQKKVFLKIPIRTFLLEKSNSVRKSLTEARAFEIATEVLYV